MRTVSNTPAALAAAFLVAAGFSATALRGQDQPRLLDLDSGELFAPSARATAITRLPQDSDYSVNRMFRELHGSFVQNAFVYQPNITLSYHNQRETSIKSDPGQFDFDQFRGEFFFPLAVDPDRFLTIGGSVNDRRYNFTSTAPVAGDEDLFRFALDLGGGWFVEEDWLLQLNFRPGVYSDLDGTLNRRDWQWFGDFVATWRVDESVFLNFGVSRDETFDEVGVYPVLGLSWKISDEFRFDMNLPKKVEFSWLPSASWIWSAGVAVEGDEYNVRAPGTKQNYYARTQEVEVYLRGTYRLDDYFSLWGRAGSTIAGHYEWRLNANGGGPPTANLAGTQDAAFFFEFGAGFSF
jgi:hypothetical protein